MENQNLGDTLNEVPDWLNTDFDKVWLLEMGGGTATKEARDLKFLETGLKIVEASRQRDVYLKLMDLKVALSVELMSKITGLDAFTLYALNHQGYELTDKHIINTINVLHPLMGLFKEAGKSYLFSDWVNCPNPILANKSPAEVLGEGFGVTTNQIIEKVCLEYIFGF